MFGRLINSRSCPLSGALSQCVLLYIELSMLVAQSNSQQTGVAGACSTDDVNIYQAVGALTCVSVVGASTLVVGYAAPLPVLGSLAAGGAAMYFGSRLDKDGKPKAQATDKKPAAKQAESNKAEPVKSEKTEAPSDTEVAAILDEAPEDSIDTSCTDTTDLAPVAVIGFM